MLCLNHKFHNHTQRYRCQQFITIDIYPAKTKFIVSHEEKCKTYKSRSSPTEIGRSYWNVFGKQENGV